MRLFCRLIHTWARIHAQTAALREEATLSREGMSSVESALSGAHSRMERGGAAEKGKDAFFGTRTMIPGLEVEDPAGVIALNPLTVGAAIDNIPDKNVSAADGLGILRAHMVATWGCRERVCE